MAKVEIARMVGGKRRHFYGKTRREAEKKYIAALAEESKGVLFSEAADAWYEEFVERAAHNSLSCYNPALKRLKARFGNRPVSDITAKDLQIFAESLARKGYAKKTVQTHLIVASNIFKRSRIEYGTENNPAQYVILPQDLPQTERDLPSEDDIKAVEKYAAQDNYGLFLMIARYTGARRGEILGLRYEDIDRETKTIRIERSVYHVGNTPHLKPPKTKAGIRTVPLLDALADLLPDGNPDDFIFGGKQPLTNSRLRDFEEAFRKETGIKSTAHQFRHLYATMLYEAEIGAKDAQHLMGHAHINTTLDIYTHIQDKKMSSIADKLNAKTKN